MYPELNLPPITLHLKNEGQGTYFFDTWRKKNVILTPEEWVRQHIAAYLVNQKKFPAGLLVLEASLKVNRLQRRSDIVIFNMQKKPLVLVECKAPEVKITQQVFDQIAAYNYSWHATILIVSNGLEHYCCKYKESGEGYEFLTDIPDYMNLVK